MERFSERERTAKHNYFRKKLHHRYQGSNYTTGRGREIQENKFHNEFGVSTVFVHVIHFDDVITRPLIKSSSFLKRFFHL